MGIDWFLLFKGFLCCEVIALLPCMFFGFSESNNGGFLFNFITLYATCSIGFCIIIFGILPLLDLILSL